MIREFLEGQKAIPFRPELTDAGGPLLSGGGPAAYNSYNGFNSDSSPRLITPLSQRNARIHMETYGGHEGIDWLADAVNFTATQAASAKWQFEKEGAERVTQAQPDDPNSPPTAPDPLIELFKTPNPYMDWCDLCELAIMDFLLVGNAYWVKWNMNSAGQPAALYRMAPQFVKIRPGQFGPEKYLYRLPGQKNDIEFTPDQIVHFKRPNPLDPYYGLGIVQAGARALDMEIELTKTAASYYQKQALPSGVVQTERRVPRDVFNKLKQQLRSFYSRSSNAGELMVLEAGLQYKAISPNASEAAFDTMGKWSRDRVFAMFNMNKALLGIWDSGDDPNIGLWQTLFDQKTMIPLTKRFANVISRNITQPGWDLDFVFVYAETQQPDEVLNRAGTLAKLPGVKVKEVRSAAGLDPSTGDKEVDEMILNKPGPELNANGVGGVPDNSLPGEPGRPPIQENTQQYQRRTGTARAPAARAGGARTTPRPTGRKAIEDILADIEQHSKSLPPADHVHVGKLSGSHVRPPEDLLHPKRTTAVDASASWLSKELNSAVTTLERGLLDALDGKASDSLYQRVKKAAAWTTFKEKLETLLTSAAEDSMSNANVHHVAQGLDTAEMDYADEAKTVVHRPDGGVISLVKTFKDRVLKAVLKEQRAGSAQVDTQAALRDAVAQWQENSIPQIALDTASVAYNHATIEIAAANGATEVLVSDGEEDDQPCIDANGSHWSLDKARKNLQEHSRCRRGFVPVVG